MIKLISTEDKIELTSPKEIVLTAGGSQLRINGDGIFTTTGGKFESKAGQDSFVGGRKSKQRLFPYLGITRMYSQINGIFMTYSMKPIFQMFDIN